MSSSSKPVVFIHTNDSQLLGAKVAAWSFRAASRRPDAFDVRLLRLEETPHLLRREGLEFRRKGKIATWHNADLQSFTPLRFLPPQALGFEGRALVVDPDVFALADVMELLERDLAGKALLCRWCDTYHGSKPFWGTSVMLLDCAKLSSWRWDATIDALFNQELDYGDWIGLKLEPQETIGRLDEEWNHFDTLTPATKMLHMTERSTQPWKTGLPVEFDTMYHAAGAKPPPPNMKVGEKLRAAATATAGGTAGAPCEESVDDTFLGRLKQRLGFSRAIPAPRASPPPAAPAAPAADVLPRYLRHPDPNQEQLFFTLLAGALADGAITDAELAENIRRDFVRHDARELLARLEPFDLDAFRAGRWRPKLAAAAARA